MARYLALHGPDGADRYLLMAGRLDMPTEFVDGALAGMLYHFPKCRSRGAVRPAAHHRPGVDRVAHCRRYFRDRYTERLSDTGLRKAIYVYATADTVVGRLAEPELRFLQDNGAAVIAGEGANHYTPALDQAILDRIRDALQKQP